MCKYKTSKTASWLLSQCQANQCCQNDTANIKTRLLFYNSKAQVCWRASTKPASTHHLISQLAIFWPHFFPSLPWWLEVKTSRQVARERLWHIFVFFQEVSSQLISTTSVLSVLVGGIYNGKWLPVRPILWIIFITFKNPMLLSQVYGSLLAAVASLLDRSKMLVNRVSSWCLRSGHIMGLPCVDHLHYLLSVANIFLVQGNSKPES